MKLINDRRKLLTWLVLIIASVFSSYSFSEASRYKDNKKPRDLKEIIASGEIRVAMLKTDEMPFFYHNKEGKFVGVDVELLEIIEKDLGVKVKLIREAETFDGVVDLVAYGEADLAMSYLSITIERAKRVSYTIPYALNYFAIAVNRVSESRGSRESIDTNDFFNQSTTRLGVQLGSSLESFARRRFPNATLVGIADSSKNALAVANGEVDAAISAKLTMEPLLKETPKLNFLLRTVVYPDEPDYMAAVVHPESTHLLNWMNTFLGQKKLLGKLDEIQARNGITIKTNQKKNKRKNK